MKQIFTKPLKNQRGVTLIELLAVIIILGIIAAIAVPAVISNFSDAKKNSDAQTEKIIKEAVQRYLLDNEVTFDANNRATIKIKDDLVSKGYLQDIPKWSDKKDIVSIDIIKGANGRITFDKFNPEKPSELNTKNP
jgi:prepilin-type N-terminal cleavage/methylation domain-containing protein